MCVIVTDPNGCLSSAWTGKGEESVYRFMFREEARAWSRKFLVAPESTRAAETTPERQPASEMGTRKVWQKTMMEYAHLPWETEDHLCPSGIQVGTHRTPLKLVPLLAAIGTEPQLSPATPLFRGKVCGPYLHGFRLCLRTAKAGGLGER